MKNNRKGYIAYHVNRDTRDAILGLKAYYKEDKDIVFNQNQIVELSIKQWYKTLKKKLETF